MYVGTLRHPQEGGQDGCRRLSDAARTPDI
jgi:hypothetical protein